jgi:hypothetical protein
MCPWIDAERTKPGMRAVMLSVAGSHLSNAA